MDIDRMWTDHDSYDDTGWLPSERIGGEEEEPVPYRPSRICPNCNGTTISPYDWDGGSCPHCFGGYLD